MDIANSRQQTNTELIMDTQTEVKEFVKNAVLNATMMIGFNEKVLKIITKGLEEVDDEELKEVATRTLLRFAQFEFKRQCDLLGLGIIPIALATLQIVEGTRPIVTDTDVKIAQQVINETIKQVPISRLNETYSQLGNSQAKVSYGQSLYGKAELSSRFNEQNDMVQSLKEKTRLVISDTHSDCSDRCAKWQGRVYSLDGTYGTTEDGKEYIPLEIATNAVFKGYRNGHILGYNCRHKLYPYKTGMTPNKVSEEEREREYGITGKQRLFEREIRKAKDLALTFERGSQNTRQFSKQQIDFMNMKHLEYKNKATMLTREYNKFCEENNRVKYRSRLQV